MTRAEILVVVVLSAVISALLAAGVLYFVLWRGGASIEQTKGEQVVPTQHLQKAAKDAQTLGERDADRIELDELIQLYMLPAGVSYTLLPWDTGSAPGTPIAWEHVGVKKCEAYQEKEFGMPYCRTGSVVITVNGKPTHTVLGKIVEPGRWKVTLMGARGWFKHVSIDCGCLSHDLSTELGETATSDLKVTSLKKCADATSGIELLRVTSPGKKPAFVRHIHSCGSGGCGEWFVLTSDEKDAEQLIASKCRPYDKN